MSAGRGIRSLQRGDTTFGASTSASQAITAVVMAASQAFGGMGAGGDDDAIRVELVSTTSLTFRRNATTGAPTTPYEVVEEY